MKDVIILTGSESLATVIAVELIGLGYSVGKLGDRECRLLVVDADSHTALGGVGAVRHKSLLCVSREPEKIGDRIACDAILRRPISSEQLRESASALLKLPEIKATVPTVRVKKDKIRLNAEEHTVSLNSKKIQLSENEFAIFSHLYKKRGEPVSREELTDTIGHGGGNEIDVYICFLRRKFEADGKRRIFTVRGVGYKLQ